MKESSQYITNERILHLFIIIVNVSVCVTGYRHYGMRMEVRGQLAGNLFSPMQILGIKFKLGLAVSTLVCGDISPARAN